MFVFDDIIKIDNISSDEKSHGNILNCDLP